MQTDFGNGDYASNDGWNYRGRGAIQLTGKENYSNFARYKKTSLANIVPYLETADGAIEVAGWFWDSRNCNAAADRGDVKAVTKLINGGYNGLSERGVLYTRALRFL